MSNCTICLYPLLTDLKVARCGHCFHSNCILQWFNTKKQCPNCNKKLKKREIFKLYLSPANAANDSTLQTLVTLQTEVDELHQQIKTLKTDKIQLQNQNNEIKSKLEQQQQTTTSYIQKNIDIDEECDELKGQISKLRQRIQIFQFEAMFSSGGGIQQQIPQQPHQQIQPKQTMDSMSNTNDLFGPTPDTYDQCKYQHHTNAGDFLGFGGMDLNTKTNAKNSVTATVTQLQPTKQNKQTEKAKKDDAWSMAAGLVNLDNYFCKAKTKCASFDHKTANLPNLYSYGSNNKPDLTLFV